MRSLIKFGMISFMVLLLLLPLLAACGDNDETPSPTTSPTVEPTPTAETPTPESTVEPTQTPVAKEIPVGPEGDAFYIPPDTLPEDKPGDIIWAREITPPPGAKAWLVLYRSTSSLGDPIAISGWIIAPEGTAPEEGWPILAWAHGTTGIADKCAPTRGSVGGGGIGWDSIAYLDEFISAGYVVTSTDYEGVGTPGPGTYTTGPSEAHAVLDSARAAIDMGISASDMVVAFGRSQGGHAAAFANEYAAEYAPDLDLVGIVGSGPGVVPNAVAMIEWMKKTEFRGYLIMGIAATEYAFGEHAPASDYLTERCLEELYILEEGCGTEIPEHFNNIPWEELFLEEPVITPGRAEWEAKNEVGHRLGAAPVLLVHGSADPLIPAGIVRSYAEKTCDLGQENQLIFYPDAGHVPAVESKDDVLSWIADRFAGEPAPCNCDNLPEP